MSVEIGRQNIIQKFCFVNNKAAQFPVWEYINGNQTFTVYWILTGPSFAVRMKVETITIHFFCCTCSNVCVTKSLLSLILKLFHVVG
jgi:hypothetical protein